MRNEGLITLRETNSYITERYKMLRTNLNTTNFEDKKTLLITSSTFNEGKSNTASNLAVTIAKTGKKVLLIECDLRSPKIHELFTVAQVPGLTELLSGKKSFSDIVKENPSCKGLDILTSGELSTSPSELLESSSFETLLEKAKEEYDSIIIDAPPVNHFTDAAIIAKRVDGVLLVVVAKKTQKTSIESAKKAFKKVGANILGVVLIQVEKKKKVKI